MNKMTHKAWKKCSFYMFTVSHFTGRLEQSSDPSVALLCSPERLGRFLKLIMKKVNTSWKVDAGDTCWGITRDGYVYLLSFEEGFDPEELFYGDCVFVMGDFAPSKQPNYDKTFVKLTNCTITSNFGTPK